MLRVLPRALSSRQQCIIYYHPALLSHRPIRPSTTRRERRGFVNVPTALVPPLVFGGLVIVLWTWKCCMMILFQNRIIYMPGLPPNARRETIADYVNRCGGIQWREEKTRSSDGTQISLCVASVDSSPAPAPAAATVTISQKSERRIYILYFQGNASSLPPRLPFLSPVLRMLRDRTLDHPVRYIMVCCSYRGYWTSKGRPSEKGIALDAEAALRWIKEEEEGRHPENPEPINLIIWGQSIGAGVATNLAARQSRSPSNTSLRTLILETPFLGIRAMLETLYPQRWLPYRYLWPFLRNHLDSWEALGSLRRDGQRSGIGTPLSILILVAGKDELVPASHGTMLQERCVDLGLLVEKRVVGGALHTEVLTRAAGRVAVVEAIRDVARDVRPGG